MSEQFSSHPPKLEHQVDHQAHRKLSGSQADEQGSSLQLLPGQSGASVVPSGDAHSEDASGQLQVKKTRIEEARLLFVPGVLVLAAATAFAVALLTLDPSGASVVKTNQQDSASGQLLTNSVRSAQVPTPNAVPAAPAASSPSRPTPASSARELSVGPLGREASSSALRQGQVEGGFSPSNSVTTTTTTASGHPPVAVVVAGYRPKASRQQIRAADQRASSVVRRLRAAGWQVRRDAGSASSVQATTVFYEGFASNQASRVSAILPGSTQLRQRSDRLPGRGIFIVVLARG